MVFRLNVDGMANGIATQVGRQRPLFYGSSIFLACILTFNAQALRFSAGPAVILMPSVDYFDTSLPAPISFIFFVFFAMVSSRFTFPQIRCCSSP